MSKSCHTIVSILTLITFSAWWSLAVSTFLFNNNLLTGSSWLRNTATSSTWIVMILVTLTSNLFLWLIRSEFWADQSATNIWGIIYPYNVKPSCGIHVVYRTIDTILVLSTICTTSMCLIVVSKHAFLPIVCCELVLVLHKLISTLGVVQWDIRCTVSVYLHDFLLVWTLARASFATCTWFSFRFFVQWTAECIFVIGPFLFDEGLVISILIIKVLIVVAHLCVSCWLLVLKALIQLLYYCSSFVNCTPAASAVHCGATNIKASSVCHMHFVSLSPWSKEASTKGSCFLPIISSTVCVFFRILKSNKKV